VAEEEDVVEARKDEERRGRREHGAREG